MTKRKPAKPSGPAPPNETPYQEKFYGKTMPEPNSGCLLWIAGEGAGGYGAFHFEGRKHSAHRIAWRFAHGPIPVGLDVCHRCDTPACVNVDHLFLGTHADNMRDCAAKGRMRHPITDANKQKTHCIRGHALAGDSLYVTPQGARHCRTCAVMRDHAASGEWEPAPQNKKKTHCKRGHEFTAENTIRRGPDGIHRECRQCVQSYRREWKKRAAVRHG